MLANDLRKGDRVVLHNGWNATIKDNKKGNIRVATVEGFATETGSIYIWDIKGRVLVGEPVNRVQYLIDFSSGKMLEEIELTPKQAKHRATVKTWGF